MGRTMAGVALRRRGVLVDLLLATAVVAFTIPTTAIGRSFSLWGPVPDWIEFLVGSVTALTMFVRRRTAWPAIVASVACACVTGQTVPMVLAAFSMTSECRMRSWSGVALALTGVYAAVDYVNPYTDQFLYLCVVRAVTLIYLPALVGTWVCAYRRMVGELRAGVREREELAASEERRKIARELHDTVTHAVTVMVLNAGVIRDYRDSPEVSRLAAGIEDKGVQALGELRQLLTVLRREDQPAVKGPEGITRLVEESQRMGMRISLHLDVPPQALPRQVAHASYRLVQEGLSNVRKHAPDSEVRVTCTLTGDDVNVSVVNTAGRGDEPAGDRCDDRGTARAAPSMGGGFGLPGLGERVALAGGRLTAEPTPEGGFVLAARFSVRPGKRSAVLRPRWSTGD
ncbi:sensor histidine kinase [Microbispora corallina]|uniref:sensor histidine kinase n=1 Tax=Microbispora corallina TaxID=83302 RepID=UPI001951DE18|nr:histidine kinase [Microbispora corallina]